MRTVKKNEKLRKAKTKESAKRQKLSYEIAGIYYADINKVKAKARAIMNLKKDGEKVTGNDEAFLKELLNYHTKAADKSKGMKHIEVGQHPDFEKTRCFFVAKASGELEDFSISKCIMNLEQQGTGKKETAE